MKAKEFLEENYKLRRKLDKIKIKQTKQILNLLKLLKENKDSLDLDEIIKGFERELESSK